jgi:hypothetical protein
MNLMPRSTAAAAVAGLSKNAANALRGQGDERPRQGSAIDPDPIFALIERHRAKYGAVTLAMAATDAATVRHGHGATEVGPFEHAQSAALDETTEAEIALAQTGPTTLLGVLAVMRYRRELGDGCDGYQLFPDKGMGADPRHEITSWLATIETSLAAITQPGWHWLPWRS